MVLILVVTVVGILLIMGFMGSRELNQNLIELHSFHNHRLVTLAANSAIEEVSTRLEMEPSFSQIPLPTGGPRDLGQLLGFPRTYTPFLAREDFRKLQVDIGDVTVESSRWVGRSWTLPNQWTLQREIAAMQFSFSIKTVRSAGITQLTTVVAHRYVEASPEAGSNVCKVKVHGYNLLFNAN